MKKKLLSILLVLSLMLALVPAAFAADVVDSGTCGISAASPCWSGWRARTTSSALRPFTTALDCAAATCWSCADRS